MTSKNTVRLISAILVILIIIFAVLLWSRHTPQQTAHTTFTSKFGYTISIPSTFKTYEDANGMVGFGTLIFKSGTTTLDYQATYGANKEGFSIVAMIPDPGLVPMLFDMMTQTQATSTSQLPQGVVLMREGDITPADAQSPEGGYRGANYSFRTARGVYALNVFSTTGDVAARTELAHQILSSFRER